MSDIDPIAERLSAALGRIGKQIEAGARPAAQTALSPGAADAPPDLGPELAALRAELAEKTKALDAASRAAQREQAVAGEAVRAGTAELESLRSALEQERAANEELGARVEALRGRLDGKDAERDKAMGRRMAQVEELDQQMQRLQQVNSDLRDINGQMRRALAEHVADAELINRAMEAELQALRATRAAEAAEVSAVMDELKLIAEGAS